MGDRGTEENVLKSKFFNKMDEFLEQTHNVKPIAVASSPRGTSGTHVIKYSS